MESSPTESGSSQMEDTPMIQALALAIDQRYSPLDQQALLRLVDQDPVSRPSPVIAMEAYYAPLSLIVDDEALVTRAYQLMPDNPRSFMLAPSRQGQEILDVHAQYHDQEDTESLVRAIEGITVSHPLLAWWKGHYRQYIGSKTTLAYLLARLETGVVIEVTLEDIHHTVDVLAFDLERTYNSDQLEEIVDHLRDGGLLAFEPMGNEIEAIAQSIVDNYQRMYAYPELVALYDMITGQGALDSHYEEAYDSLTGLRDYQLILLGRELGVPSYGNREDLIPAILRRLASLPLDAAMRLPFPLPRTYRLLTAYSSTLPYEEMYLPDLVRLASAVGITTDQPYEILALLPRTTTVDDPVARWRQALALFPVERVIDQLGIVVPPWREPTDYVERTLPDYAEMLIDRWTEPIDLDNVDARTLSHYTDVDLISLTGAYPAFADRRSLIHTLARLSRSPDLFVPLSDRCANGMFTSSVLAYGTLTDYDCLTVEQLIELILTSQPQQARDRVTWGDRVVSLRNLHYLISTFPYLEPLRHLIVSDEIS